MTLILSGSDGLSDVDGSAATPAIRGTDANTGIFFPAADTIAFSEGGVEAARFDSAGNLGIGTTSPVSPLTAARGNVTGAGQWASSAIAVYNPTNTGAYSQISFGYTSGTTNASAYMGFVSTNQGSNGFGDLVFGTRAVNTDTQPTERARILSDGVLLVGTSTTFNGTSIEQVSGNPVANQVFSARHTGANPNGMYLVYTGATPNGGANYFILASDGTTRFYVASNGGVVNYQANDGNLSDRREKTNFAPAKSYLDVICSIPVQTFNYIDQNREEDDGLTLGVVAQDVQAVAPELVMESNWAGKDEEPKMRLSIYQTDLQYALMKCIQEQQALITQLQADVAALKA